MDANKRFTFIVIGVGLFFIAGIVWWSRWGTSRWFPAGFRNERVEQPGDQTIQERLLSGMANGAVAPVSAEERKSIIEQLTSTSAIASPDPQVIINALAPPNN